MNLSRTFVVTAAIVLLALLGVGLFFLLRQDAAPADPLLGDTQGTLPDDSEVFDILKDPDARMRQFEADQARLASEAPQTPRLTIQGKAGTVSVRNFFASSTFVEGTNEVILAQQNDFDIRFDRASQQFMISAYALSAEQFREIKLLAEAEFLRLLDISEADACKLAVWHVTPPENFEGQELEEGSYPLTFCGASAASGS